MSIGKAPGFMFYVKDWRSSRRVQRMSFKERGMYLEMLLEQWDGGSLPDTAKAIQETLGGSLSDWQKAWSILSPNFEIIEGRLVNRRLEQERDKQAKYRRRQSDNAAARWEKEKPVDDAMALPRHSHGIATVMPPHVAQIASGNALHLPLQIADCRLQIASSGAVGESPGLRDSDTRSNRIVHRGQRFVIFEWQLEELCKMLGSHAEAFHLDEWFYTADAKAVASGLVRKSRDWWPWVQEETLAEAMRRGLPVEGVGAVSEDEKFAALIAKGPSVRP